MRVFKVSVFVFLLSLIKNENFIKADDGSESTIVDFLSPDIVRKQSDDSKTIYHKNALFGAPFAKTNEVIGNIQYISGNACNQEDLLDAYSKPDNSDNSPKIWLVQRGKCHFTDKVRLAQNNGAVGILIMDDVCLERKKEDWKSRKLWKSVCQEKGSPDIPLLGSGGLSLSDIKIPAFLISKYDGNRLSSCYISARDKLMKENLSHHKNYSSADPSDNEKNLEYIKGLNNNDCTKKEASILVKLSLEVIKSDKIDWEMWLNNEKLPDIKEIEKLESLENILANKIKDFQPHMVLRSADNICTKDSCDSYCLFEEKGKNKGFCNFGKSNNHKEIIEESIVQLCLWEKVKGSEKKLWWTYLKEFKGCVDNSKKFESCREKSLPKEYKNKVLECLDSEKKEFKVLNQNNLDNRRGGIYSETFVINGLPINFGFSAFNFLTEACNTFFNKPEHLCSCVEKSERYFDSCINKKCFEDKRFLCPNAVDCETNESMCITKQEINNTIEKTSSSVWPYIFAVFLITGIASALFVSHRRQQRRLQENMRDILAEYVPIDGFSANGGGSSSFSHRINEDSVGVI